MLESTFGGALSSDIERKMGGKIFKISDRSTLGLPDYIHLLTGIATYIETKIGDEYTLAEGFHYIQPWKIIKKDIRQYEVCKLISRHTLVLYAIYYPEIRKTAILTMDNVEQLRPDNPLAKIPWLNSADILQVGYGSNRVVQLMINHRKEVHASLSVNHGESRS
jgi:hypothetical protein